MSNRRALDWSRALPSIGADRLARTAVYEDRLRNAGSFTSNTGLDVSCWVGRPKADGSRKRYVVGVYTLEHADPRDLSGCVALFVGRRLDGIGYIIRATYDLTVTCAEHELERACAEGATEVHVHRLAAATDRPAIVADLSARVLAEV